MWHWKLPFPNDFHICTLCVTSWALVPCCPLVPSWDGSPRKCRPVGGTRARLDLPPCLPLCSCLLFSHVKHLTPVMSAHPNPAIPSKLLLGIWFPQKKGFVPSSHPGDCWIGSFASLHLLVLPFLKRKRDNLARAWQLLSSSQVCWWESDWAQKQDSASAHLFSFTPSFRSQAFLLPSLGLDPGVGVRLCYLASCSKHTWTGPCHGRWSFFSGWDNSIWNLPFQCT